MKLNKKKENKLFGGGAQARDSGFLLVAVYASAFWQL